MYICINNGKENVKTGNYVYRILFLFLLVINWED